MPKIFKANLIVGGFSLPNGIFRMTVLRLHAGRWPSQDWLGQDIHDGRSGQPLAG